MLSIGVNHKWDACTSKDNTQAPVHPHIKLSKYRTWIIWAWWKLAWRYSHVSSEHFSLYKSLSRPVLCYKKDWATLLHFIYFCYLLPITNYLIIKLYVTNNFSACREHLTENRLSFPSAPRWVRHSYLSKDYDWSPILVGHQESFLAALPGSEVLLARKTYYYMLEFIVTSLVLAWPMLASICASCLNFWNLNWGIQKPQNPK